MRRALSTAAQHSTATAASPLIARAARRVRYLLPVPPDARISAATRPLPIGAVARDAGLLRSEVALHGAHAAKVSPAALQRLSAAPSGSYVLVTGMTPTPLGEGKSTVAVGLCQALGAHLGRRALATLRQPSQGPTFGIKGGAAGGGYAQVIPSALLNLHLTGDLHAVGAATNLLAAAVDARRLHEATCSDDRLFDKLCPAAQGTGARALAPSLRRRLAALGLAASAPGGDAQHLAPAERAALVRLSVDPATITWRRVVDVCDRHLRGITIGQGPAEAAVGAGSGSGSATQARATGFDICVASEAMAVLALAEGYEDLRERLGRIVVARSSSGAALTAEDFGCAGAMAVLLREALSPTLLQTLEGTGVLVHAGPFADIAHGSSSVLADRVALKLVGPGGFCVTEAGFGGDVGAEKFFNIKCRASGLVPNAVVLVATVRALKVHGGGPAVTPGQVLDSAYREENLGLLGAGMCNLVHHVEALRAYGVPVVVAVNRFSTDTDAEIALVKAGALAAGAVAAEEATHWEHGGAGAVALAHAVVAACATTPTTPTTPTTTAARGINFTYPLTLPLRDKVLAIAKTYGAGAVEYSAEASAALERFTAAGYGHFPICMAKTPLSLTADPKVKGAPKGFTVRVREVRASVGAGFLTCLLGEVSTIPGLPIRPRFYDVDLTPEGGIVGL